jgi:hypothetical protein
MSSQLAVMLLVDEAASEEFVVELVDESTFTVYSVGADVVDDVAVDSVEDDDAGEDED